MVMPTIALNELEEVAVLDDAPESMGLRIRHRAPGTRTFTWIDARLTRAQSLELVQEIIARWNFSGLEIDDATV